MAAQEYPEFSVPRLATIAHICGEADGHIQALDEATFSSQRHIASIAAPTGGEEERARWVAAAFRSTGCDTRCDAAGNVIASLPGEPKYVSAQPVVCMAHLDTVFNHDVSLEMLRQGSRAICPGIGDNGRGLAAMLTLARVFAHIAKGARQRGRPLEFVASVGEEGLGNLRGARAYFAHRACVCQALPHAVVVLDGPGDDTIVHHALGSRRYRISFQGPGGHSWADFGTPNAVHAAARAAAMLSEIPRHLHQQMALTTSGIGGGESMNAIPSAAFIEVDVRGTDSAVLVRAEAELHRVVQLAVEQECENAARVGFAHPWRNGTRNGTQNASRNALRNASRTAPDGAPLLRSQVMLLGERPCGSLSLQHPLVQLAQEATVAQLLQPISAIASTDANIPLSLGIPAITIGGGGSGGGAHTVHEWYDNTHGPRGISRAFAILAALAA